MLRVYQLLLHDKIEQIEPRYFKSEIWTPKSLKKILRDKKNNSVSTEQQPLSSIRK